MQFNRAFEQQKETPCHQDQVAAGKLSTAYRQERSRQAHQRGNRGQQGQPHDQRQQQSQHPRAITFRGRQFVGQDGNENEVVDPQDDLEDHQG